MNRLFYLILVGLALSSCGARETGELTGVLNRPVWFDVDPYGTVYIPMGSFVMGENNQDIAYAQLTKARTVSVQAMYMDDTEITNNEYRQFVEWVRDSIALVYLQDVSEEEYAILVDKYGRDLDEPKLNWSARIPWDSEDEDVQDALAPLFYQGANRYYGKKQIDVGKLIYEYSWIDYKAAAKKGRLRHYMNADGSTNSEEWTSNRYQFIRENRVAIYPDTLCWIADFTYSYNDPATQMYFWHPAYDDYPVVGVTWEQANAFSRWRTNLFNRYLTGNGVPIVQDFRLPTEGEWEYASRGGIDLSRFPWGGPYIRNDRGCFLANFKPLRGNYVDDGGFHTVPAYSYSPNDYGLYCMAGNVAEWTISTYDESSYEFSHDMNPSFQYDADPSEHPVMKRKVVRGGSWKDIAYFLETGVRAYEYQDTAKSYIGFRNTMTYLGRAKSAQ